MPPIDPKQKVAILRVLREAHEPVGSEAITQELEANGMGLSSRTVRLYLQEMERLGLVECARRGRGGGRAITPRGIEEIQDAMVSARLGLTAAKVDSLACQMTFDPATAKGLIVLNVTTIEETSLQRAMDIMAPVFRARLAMSDRIALARAGETLGNFRVPKGTVAVGTVCSITINGVLLRAGIPATSRFGGVLEMEEWKPQRFTDIITYDGTSLDPLQIFIKGRLLSVRETVERGSGRIGASFREVPSCSLERVEKVLRRLRRIGLSGVLLLGKPNQPLLDFSVHEGRTGMIVTGGMNPAATLEEADIPNRNFAMSTLYPYEATLSFQEAAERAERGEYAPVRRLHASEEGADGEWLQD